VIAPEREDVTSTRLANRHALVTGGSRGIGAAIVNRLAHEGAHVALTYVGRAEQAAAIDRFRLEDFDRTVAVNLRAVFVATQAAVRHMPAGGRIINIGSCNAERMPFAGGAVYAMSKAALVGRAWWPTWPGPRPASSPGRASPSTAASPPEPAGSHDAGGSAVPIQNGDVLPIDSRYARRSAARRGYHADR
jgi:hypothetical protein